MSDLPRHDCRTKIVFARLRKCVVKSHPVARSLVCGFYGVVPPSSDVNDPAALLYGSSKRAFVRLPEPDPKLLSELRLFTRKWLIENMKPIFEIPDLDGYLNSIHVPQYKKDDIRRGHEFYMAHHEILDAVARWHNGTSVSDWVPSSWKWIDKVCPFSASEMRLYRKFVEIVEFAKTEYYPAIKPTRGINASQGGVKSRVGPYFHRIEEELFKKHWFIKKVEVYNKIDAVLKLHKPNYSVQSSDFSSFEGSFTRIVQLNLEYELYDYMFPKDENFRIWNRTLISPRLITNKCFDLVTDPCRMSGETNTSLGNGFSNLMIMLYSLEKFGNVDINGLVEGDDGLFTFSGPGVDSKFFEKLGFKVKLLNTAINTASFCGMVFDLNNKVIMSDPFYCLASSGFSFSAVGSSKKNLNNLTCARGLSIMYQYSGCPVLAAWGLRMYKTGLEYSGHSDESMRSKLLKYYSTSQKIDQWERDKMLRALSGREQLPIAAGTRVLFSQLYGISPEMQEFLERDMTRTTGWYYNECILSLFRNRTVEGLGGEVSSYSSWCDNWFKLQECSETPTRLQVFEPVRS